MDNIFNMYSMVNVNNMVSMDLEHLLPDFSFDCTICGHKEFMESSDVVFRCKRRVHCFCEFCYNTVINLTGCEVCRSDPKYVRDEDEIDLDACPNKSRGCTYFKRDGSDLDFQMHCAGCRLRILCCPLYKMNMSRCGWCGSLQEIEYHIRIAHPVHYGKIICDTEVTIPLNINCDESAFYFVRYHCELFYYKHRVILENRNFYIYVQMLASEDEANSYFYQVKIRKNEKTLNIMEMCHNDSTRDDYMIECEKCIIIPLKTLKKYVEDGVIRFTLSVSNSARNSLYLTMR